MQREVWRARCAGQAPAAERTHNHEIEAGRLSGKQSEIIVEVDKALLGAC